MHCILQDLVMGWESNIPIIKTNNVVVCFVPLGRRKHLSIWGSHKDINDSRDTLAAMWMQPWTQCSYPSLYKSFLYHTLFVSPSHPFPVTLWCVCLPLCRSVRGIGGPRGIDWARLNAVRLMGDMWFTDEILALVHSASNHSHSQNTHTHTGIRALTRYVGSKHIHTHMSPRLITHSCINANARTHT